MFIHKKQKIFLLTLIFVVIILQLIILFFPKERTANVLYTPIDKNQIKQIKEVNQEIMDELVLKYSKELIRANISFKELYTIDQIKQLLDNYSIKIVSFDGDRQTINVNNNTSFEQLSKEYNENIFYSVEIKAEAQEIKRINDNLENFSLIQVIWDVYLVDLLGDKYDIRTIATPIKP